MLAHRQTGAWLGVAWGFWCQVFRADGADQLQALGGGFGSGQFQEGAAQAVTDGQWCVRRGIDTTGDAGFDASGCDGVGHVYGCCDAGAAGHLDVRAWGLRIKRGA
mgnify:CR=1 FL=1